MHCRRAVPLTDIQVTQVEAFTNGIIQSLTQSVFGGSEFLVGGGVSFLSLLEVKKTICTVKRVDIVQIKGITFHRTDENVFHYFLRGLSFPVLGGLSFLSVQRSDLYREMTADGVL